MPHVSSIVTAPPTALRLMPSASAIAAAGCCGGSQINSQPMTRPVAGGTPYCFAKWRPTRSTNASSCGLGGICLKLQEFLECQESSSA